MTESARPGAILKALRAKRGWTLSDVSQRTGFPVSTLSKIENDKVSLSYDKLARISTRLDVDIGLFFSEVETKPAPGKVGGGRRSIIRKGDGQTIQTGSYFNRFLATDLLNKRFVPMIGEGLASSIEDFGEMIRHEGEEFCYVLEGALELHSELYAPVRLETGDAIYFDSGMGHAYISVGDTPCRALCICSGEESKLGGVTDDTFSDLSHPGRSDTRPPTVLKAVPKKAKLLPAQRVAKKKAPRPVAE